MYYISMQTGELFEKIYSRILDFISYQPRTTHEVSQKIDKLSQRWDLSPEELAELKSQVITELKEIHLLSDLEFAKSYVSSFSSGRSTSAQKIRTFLYKKGIDRQIVDEAIKDMDPEFEFASALADGEKKLRILQLSRNYDANLAHKKLYMYLLGKGYPYNVCNSVVDRIASVK